METLMAQIQQLAATTDDQGRRQLTIALRSVLTSLESADDTIHRFGHMAMQSAAIQVGFDLGLFTLLSNAPGALASREMAQVLGVEQQLLERILRFLAAVDLVNEVSANCYAPNNVTRNLTEVVVAAGLGHYFSTVAPQYDALPAFLKRTQYKTPVDGLHTVFQDAWKTPLHAFEWFSKNPDQLSFFNDYMALRRPSNLSWLSVYPVTHEVQGWDNSRALYVNIGGGIGHQAAQFKARYPDLPGRVIVQDLPHSIAKALQTPGVENMVHDFFQPQPVKGECAKFYYLRGVLHNHPPQQARRILEHTKAAMGPESVLLIDEMTLPETGVNLTAAAIDVTMLTAFAGLERTEAQWRETLHEVDLELVKTLVYHPLQYESVMHVRLPVLK